MIKTMNDVIGFYVIKAEVHATVTESGETMQLFFECDPEKNTECKKGASCQTQCFLTSYIDFAKHHAKFK